MDNLSVGLDIFSVLIDSSITTTVICLNRSAADLQNFYHACDVFPPTFWRFHLAKQITKRGHTVASFQGIA